MASGHVNRTIRPNTWPQPTKALYVQKVLANREPSTHGTSRKCRLARRMSLHRRKPDLSRHSPVYNFPEENLIDWMHTPGNPRPGPGAPTPAPLQPLKPLSVP